MGQTAGEVPDPFLRHGEYSVSQAHLVHEAAYKQEGGQGQHVEVSQSVCGALGKHDEGLVVEDDELKAGGQHGVGDGDLQQDQCYKSDKIYRQIRIKVSQRRTLPPAPQGHKSIHRR